MSRQLSIARVDQEVPDRGPLMTPQEIADDPELFRGKVNEQWVRRNLPTVRLGHSTVMVFRNDAREWLEARRRTA